MTEEKTKVSGETVSDPEELREQIEEDREELGDTVEALAEKADVKSQVKAKVGETTEQVKQRQVPIGAAVGGVLAALLLLRLLRRK